MIKNTDIGPVILATDLFFCACGGV